MKQFISYRLFEYEAKEEIFGNLGLKVIYFVCLLALKKTPGRTKQKHFYMSCGGGKT